MTTIADLGFSTGDLDLDRAELRTAASEHAALLRALGPVRARDDSAAARAAAAHRDLRRLRRKFLRQHLRTVYRAATDDLRRGLRLSELGAAAAELFPGLLPDPAQLGADAEVAQPDKEGWEIDQGIFFHAVFADPVAGNHLLDQMRAPTTRATDLLAEFQSTGAITLPAVHLARSGATSTITITNTACLNAEDNQHVADMETAVDLVLLDPMSHVGVVRGGEMEHPRYRGKRVFSAGINLAHLHQGKISFIDFLLRRETGYIAKILRGLAQDDAGWPVVPACKPWIAAVDSFAIGGGAQLLMVFDRVIASTDSYISLPAAQEGIIPGAANLRLGRASNFRLSRDVILWGRKLWATDPDARFVLDTVVEPAAMDHEIAEAATRLASPAVVANKHMLVGAEEPQDVFRRYLSEFSLHQAMRLYSADVLAKTERFQSAGR
ncbi:(3,5-dihydroxyphenyl)acetyl-CoA 1,2-dioxygenase DpgC [Nocardia iowensis]|uniref:Enoyl-CoA hydratase/isomerase family protein n=1 Tax=Nocardia iowensis TaxID=204891 RepID=A0ABX8RXK6_NOCIO|nr:(3,5-dihydroxyphenyl)acetyl-CoA 1,2-dioxygenase DpgC [Nocardia iowensis]QXN94373.1 enoyl-CoA hydratase/isomerase family protein [Nocardia iowensis]